MGWLINSGEHARSCRRRAKNTASVIPNSTMMSSGFPPPKRYHRSANAIIRLRSSLTDLRGADRVTSLEGVEGRETRRCLIHSASAVRGRVEAEPAALNVDAGLAVVFELGADGAVVHNGTVRYRNCPTHLCSSVFWSPADVIGVVGPVAGRGLLPLDCDGDVDVEHAGQDGGG